jgi:hypothetical protein
MPMLALPIVGAIAGAALDIAVVGGFAAATFTGVMAAASIGFTVGSIAANLLFPTITKTNNEGSRLTDLSVQSSAYGVVIPIGYGKIRVSGNIIWAKSIQEVINVQTTGGGGGKKGGGKGDSTQQTTTTYTYYGTLAIMLCEGPVREVLRVWANDKLQYDVTGGSDVVMKAGFSFRFYPGDQGQLPDSAIVADRGNLTPAYRGRCYVVFENLLLTDYGNRVPNFSFELAVSASYDAHYYPIIEKTPSIFVAGSASPNIDQVPQYSSDVTLDPVRMLGYAKRIDVTTGTPEWGDAGGIVQFDVNTMQVIREVNVREMMGGGLAVAACLCMAVGPDMALYAYVAGDQTDLGRSIPFGSDWCTYQGPGRDARIVRIDPNTMGITASFPIMGIIVLSISPHCRNGTLAFFMPRFFVSCASGLGAYLVVFGTASNIGVLKVPDLSYVWHWPEDDEEGAPQCGCTGEVTATYGDCYYVWYKYPYREEPYVVLRRLSVGAGGGVSITDVCTYHKGDLTDNTTIGDFASMSVQYDRSNHIIVLGLQVGYGYGPGSGESFLLGIDALTGRELWRTHPVYDLPWGFGWPISTDGTNTHQSSILNGHYALQNGIFDTNTGKIAADTANSQMASFPMTWIYESTTSVIMGTYPSHYYAPRPEYLNKVVKVQLLRLTPMQVSLQSIFDDICTRSGFASSDYSTTELANDIVDGFMISQKTNGADILRPLMDVFQIDAVESDYKIKFHKRGGATITALVEDDFIRSKDNAPPYEETRTQELELPQRVTLTYNDVNRDNQTGTQQKKRVKLPHPTMYSDSSTDLSLALTTNADLAKQQCEKLLYQAWVNRHAFNLKLPMKYAWLDAGDPVTISLNNGMQTRSRVTGADIGVDMTMETKLVAEAEGQYISTAVAQPTTSRGSMKLNAINIANLFLFDFPLLQDGDEVPNTQFRTYYACTGYRPEQSWPGAAIQKSMDGTAWEDVTSTTMPFVYGYVETPPADPVSVDRSQRDGSFVVNIPYGADLLGSVTEDQLNYGFNAAALIKGNGDVEIVQFLTVVALDDTRLKLSYLNRGRRGTDTMAYGHQPGELFIVLKVGGIRGMSKAMSERGNNEFYRATTFGTFAQTAIVKQFAFTARDKMPYAPVGVTAVNSGGNITLSWLRRTRLNGDKFNDTTINVPLNEDNESYDLEVLSGPGGTVLRTIYGIGPTPSVIYSTAVADFGSMPTTLTVKVYQLSGQVGRGYARESTVGVN